MNIIKLLTACLLSLCCLTAYATDDPLDGFINSFAEQPLTADWVMENSAKDMTERRAFSIVRDAYRYAYENQLDPLMVVAMMKQESNFKLKATSSVGAKGLMQVWPKWHKDKLNGRDPYDQKVSIEVGTTILKNCFTDHPNNKRKALKCYSGGAKNYHVKVNAYQQGIRKYVAEAARPYALLWAGK